VPNDPQTSLPGPAPLRDLLRLTLTPGLGPVLIARLLAAFGSASEVLATPARRLQTVRGIGKGSADAIAGGLAESGTLVDDELALAARLGVRLVARGDAEYPNLLDSIPDPPPLLYVKGALHPADSDRYPIGIVGSRACTAYGIEQAERFAGVLGRAGLTIVSGGARGIDTAAHRGALRSGARTIAVVGCGLAQCYPPENAELYERIAAGGAVVSELPLNTAPEARNFPARNRILSGMSLGILVIEAGRKSGALITARLAAEDHGREVMVLPGRVDSAASLGALDLVKAGGAMLVTEPGDVIELLEAPARHTAGGTHADRYAGTAVEDGALFVGPGDGGVDEAEADGGVGATASEAKPRRGPVKAALSDRQRAILDALEEPRTIDQLCEATGLEASELRSELTILELLRRIGRAGGRLTRTRG
jgi:DNA processing protein